MSEVHTQLLTDDASGLLVERRYRLRVVAGPDQGKELALEDGTTMVGTHADNDLVLSDATVSRHHLELRVRRDGIEVRDLETTNGTKHGGARIGQVILVGPARLRLGKHTELDVEPVDSDVVLGEWSGDRFGDVLGTTQPMRRLFALLAKAATTEATILLSGETGTGKEAIAEAVHQLSGRASGPFVVVDCGSIPHELIASELFGHAKGAFTGAGTDKQGLIEAANHGSLFLDEIGELALDLQPQLLRVLDRRQVRRVGETQAIDVDIRVIAATHRDLRAMIRAGQFREDLYYRLAVVATQVPPLRDRKADIPAIATWFAERMGRGSFALSPTLLELLEHHDWPGNVRELRNVVERALSLGDAALADLGDSATLRAASDPSGAADPSDLGAPSGPVGPSGTDDPAQATVEAPRRSSTAPPGDMLDLPFKEAKAALVESFERDYLTALLARHRGNISRAAAEAGIDRNYIHRLVKKYGLEVDRG